MSIFKIADYSVGCNLRCKVLRISINTRAYAGECNAGKLFGTGYFQTLSVTTGEDFFLPVATAPPSPAQLYV